MRPPEEVKKEIVRQWLAKAEQDIEAAQGTFWARSAHECRPTRSYPRPQAPIGRRSKDHVQSLGSNKRPGSLLREPLAIESLRKSLRRAVAGIGGRIGGVGA